MISVAPQLRRVARAVCVPMLLLSAVASSVAQTPVRRLFQQPASSEARVAMPGTVTGRPAKSQVVGHLTGDTALTGMSLVLKPTEAQDAALSLLLTDMQNPASANYRQWLTPAAFGARFGVAAADIAVLETWLQSRGFSVDSVAASQNRIVFSGTASAVESAFGVSMQRYRRDGQDFFENSAEVNLPASLSSVVSGITGLSSYRLPAPPHSLTTVTTATPAYTGTTTTGSVHYLVPWDFRQIFAINPLINSGYDGTGIKIGVLGQSAVDTQQLTYFQQKTGQTVKLPTLVLVPNTGVSNRVSGDEGESELDLEYASGTAPGATVQFIYTGCTSTASSTILNGTTTSCNNNGVFDAMAYAITGNLTQILTLSYGACESDVASYATGTMEPLLRQASSQGQTIMVSSGDTGASSCETASAPTVATGGLSVSYPASSPNVIAVGGTQLNGDSSTYWSSTNNAFAGSAIGYIPEIAWNDTATYGSLSESGGGASRIFGKPSWQAGTGVPTDGKRDVPDVAFPASVSVNAYIVCSEGATCSDATLGFTTGGGGRVGGTSAAAPNFAAMMAVIEQANGGGSLGNIAPSLYSLAAGATSATIFHDVTSGNNIVPCKGGTTGCSSTNSATNGTMGYTAGVGYDQVTGLGSMSANTLQSALKTVPSTTVQTPTMTLTSTSVAPALGAALTFTASVAANGTAASGTVTFTVDGTPIGTGTLSPAGVASISYTGFTTTGTHVVVASYPYAGGTVSATLNLSVAVNGGLTAAAASARVTVKVGGTTTNSITVTSTGGFAGTVNFTAALTSSNGSGFAGCYSLPSVTVAAGATASSAMTIQTTSVGCATSGVKLGGSAQGMTRLTSSLGDWPRGGLAVLSAGLLGCCFLRRRVRPSALLLLTASAMVFGLAGCGGGGTSSTTTTTAAGTYTIQVTGTGTPTGGGTNVTATTSFNIVVQ